MICSPLFPAEVWNCNRLYIFYSSCVLNVQDYTLHGINFSFPAKRYSHGNHKIWPVWFLNWYCSTRWIKAQQRTRRCRCSYRFHESWSGKCCIMNMMGVEGELKGIIWNNTICFRRLFYFILGPLLLSTGPATPSCSAANSTADGFRSADSNSNSAASNWASPNCQCC